MHPHVSEKVLSWFDTCFPQKSVRDADFPAHRSHSFRPVISVGSSLYAATVKTWTLHATTTWSYSWSAQQRALLSARQQMPTRHFPLYQNKPLEGCGHATVRKLLLLASGLRPNLGQASRPGSLPTQQVVGFQQLVIPASSTSSLSDLSSFARYRDTGSLSTDGGNGERPDAHSLYAFPFTLQQLALFRSLCVAGSLDRAAETFDVSTNYLQTVLGRLEKELNISLVAQKVQNAPRSDCVRSLLRLEGLSHDSVSRSSGLHLCLAAAANTPLRLA